MEQTNEKRIGESGRDVREPKQAEEIRTKWSWVERVVWTDRMLQRLEESQEQTVWFSLCDKVWQEDNLHQACLKVILNQGGAGVDGQTTGQLAEQWQEQIQKLRAELRDGTYQPQPLKRVWIDKLGSTEKRPLGIPAVRDRVVQTAIWHVIGPIFERDFAAHSYGFRPGRSAQQALERVESLMQRGYTWIVDADLKGYFDSIAQDRLMEAVGRRIVDGRLKELLWKYLKAGVMERGKEWQPTEEGTPQGAVISPLLANLYLNPLDHLMVRQGREMVRYADDFVVWCRSQKEAKQALEQIAAWVKEAGLQLHPAKTRLVDASEPGGFDFLGYHFERYREGAGKKWPRKKSLLKLKESIREKTGRTRSGSMEEIIAEVNRTVKGWYAYFRASIPNVFSTLDGWVRARLRSIQRRRWKRRGISKGRENREIPNRWFAERGFFSMAEAHVRRLQSHS
jgi:RNA-directed DNA polymerase